MNHDPPPWTTDLLSEWMTSLGPERLHARLGPFVLLGADVSGLEHDSRWSFTTGVRAADESSPPLRVDLTNALVHPVVKRSSTFFPTTILVGRASSNDIVLDHPSVSKLHARLKLSDVGFWVEDAGSQNGSSIDGEPIAKPVVAEGGDWLRFGDIELLVLESKVLIAQLSSAS